MNDSRGDDSNPTVGREPGARSVENLYVELRRLAERRMADERADHSLSATALVHEAFLRLGPAIDDLSADRPRFFAAAAIAMRRILIEHARRRNAAKRGGDVVRVELFDVALPLPDDRLIELDEALTSLAEEDPVAAAIVERRFFAGMSHEEVARSLDLSVSQAQRKWIYARAWLRNRLERR